MHSHNQKPVKEFYVIFGEIYNTAPTVNRSSALRAQ